MRWISGIVLCAASACALVFGAGAARATEPTWSPEFGYGTLSSQATAGCMFDDDGDGVPSLFVTGNFTTAGGVACNRIAKWDGRQWTPLGSGLLSTGTFSGNAMTVFDDGSGPALIVGGTFSSAGGIPAVGVARWKNGAWQAIGSGLGDAATFTGVVDFAVFGGSLYAGGTFGKSGALTVRGVARWTGSAWAVVNNSLGQVVDSLAVYDDGLGGGAKLYASGSFTGCVARLDAGNWTKLNVSGGSIPRVARLAVFNPTAPAGKAMLYAAGRFTNADGQARTNIAAWEGAKWLDVAGGLTVTSDFPSITAMRVIKETTENGVGEALYVAGTITAAGTTAGNFNWKFDGTGWVPVLSPGTYPYFFLPYAGPDTLGVQKIVAGVISNDGLKKLGSAGWAPLGCAVYFSPVNGFSRGASETDRPLVIATGGIAYMHDGTSTGGLLELGGDQSEPAYGGFANPANVPMSGTMSGAVAAPYGVADKLAVFTPGLSVTPCGGASLVEVRDDKSVLCHGPVFGSASFFGIVPLPGAGDELLVYGNFLDAGGIPTNDYAGFYNSTTGQFVASTDWPQPNGPVFTAVTGDVDLDGEDDLIEGGSFAQCTIDGGPGVGTDNWCAKFSGSGLVTGTGVSGFNLPPLGFVVGGVQGRGVGVPYGLYAGGTFTAAGGTQLNRVARWDGSTWQPLGAGMNGNVRALCVWDARDGRGPLLYAGGEFTTAGGLPCARIACWDGQAWSPVTSGADNGTNDRVNALYVWDAGDGRGPSLVIGGNFTLAGGKSAGKITRLFGGPNPCPADLDWSGVVDLLDYFQWFNWWDVTDPRADLDGVPGVDLGDFFAFFNHWDLSC